MSEALALEADFRVSVGARSSPFEVTAKLSLDRGVLAVFGPSGSGKSLTLQVIAGLLRPQSGRIRVGGEPLSDSEAKLHLPPHRRRVGYVPQHHALFPFCSVWRNVAFGLPRGERRPDHPVVAGLLHELGLEHLTHAMPERLSGGERQRVALARALAVRPRLLLLDEPFNSIDLAGRRELWGVLRATLARHQTPAVFVTHDPVEAAALAERVVLFERGRSTRSGGPELLEPALELVRGPPQSSGIDTHGS